MPIDRKAVQAFLQDVAESEHQIRHPEVFAALVTSSGFELHRLPHRLEVCDPDAVEPEPTATAAEPVAAPVAAPTPEPPPSAPADRRHRL